MGKEAVPLLQKSLEIVPNYYSSLVDIIMAFHFDNKKNKAKKALSNLKEIYPTSNAIIYFSNIISKY